MLPKGEVIILGNSMHKTVIRVSLLLALIAGIVAVILYRDQLDTTVLENWINEAGVLGPLLFMFLYIIGTIFFFPGSILTLAGGALFGPVLGTFYNLTGATIGAALSFIFARYLLSDWVEQKTGGRLKQLKAGVEHEGWRFVAFVRLVPLFPFNLLNYALGITRIKFIHYLVATYIFMLPGAIAYTYLGYIGKEAATGGDDLIQKSMLALAFLGIVSFLPRLISALRQGPMLDVTTLKQMLSEDNIVLIDVRSVDEFTGEQGHIKAAINIPLAELPSRLHELSDYLEKTVALICRADRRSAKAAQLLTQNGFTDVHVVKQGMNDWRKNNYPVE
jgi:uncharacterized membrane protein YdjX (TVP38/TMEM64 family)/rhodanese-related sulfurtransferase